MPPIVAIILAYPDLMPPEQEALKFYLLGICGTLMSGVALLLRELGHEVSGCDKQALSPISDLLKDAEIDCHLGYEAADLPAADCYVIGNSVSRGNPMVERILNERLPFASAPALLRDEVLKGRQVVAVSGTHGKTTITALVAAMLSEAGLEPGWLIGGIPVGGTSARLGSGAPFVIEADEYDTAFFDKSAKFLHYWPDVLLINNLEFDHADIYANLGEIQQQFHRLLRCLSESARILVPSGNDAIEQVLARGMWSGLQTFSAAGGPADWVLGPGTGDKLSILKNNAKITEIDCNMPGDHGKNNLIAAFAVALSAGADADAAARAAGNFRGVQRRHQLLLECGGVRLYEDFAHHPTAIAAVVKAVRSSLPPGGRLLAAVDLASNSMRAGSHLQGLGPAVAGIDEVFWHGQAAADAAGHWGGQPFADADSLAEAMLRSVRDGDTLFLFSNAHFGGLRQSFPARLQAHLQTTQG